VPALKSADKASSKFVLPKGLQAGARIGVACPASGVSVNELRVFEKLCLSEGYTPVMGRNIQKSIGYLSAPDQDRADEFMEFIENPEIDAIICARGGYGVMRILPMLDYKSIGQARKPIVGFSDITALLISANQLGHVVTFHGPVATSTFDSFTINSFKEVLQASSDDTTPEFSSPKITTITPGVASGRLTGGNLAVVAATLGTNYEINTRGAILFLEEINEEPYQIDRMLTHLWLAGKLQVCAGIAFGNFRNCEAKEKSISYPPHSLMRVLQDRTADLGIPVVYGLPFGHVKSKLTLPLGVRAELDATNKSLRILDHAVQALA